MSGRRTLIAVLALVLLGVGLQGCGRKGSPERPEGTTFPRAYPQQDERARSPAPPPPAEEPLVPGSGLLNTGTLR